MADGAKSFQTVCQESTSIPEGEGRAFPLNGTLVAVFRRDGEFFAINDSCPHMGASLASGYLEGCDVICPWHAWKFCVKDGLWMDNPKSKVRTESYAVRIVGNEVQVEVPKPGPFFLNRCRAGGNNDLNLHFRSRQFMTSCLRTIS